MQLKLTAEIASAEITLEKILSARVSEWFAFLVGCNMQGINEFDPMKSRNSLVRV